jgi:hypothetical protein
MPKTPKCIINKNRKSKIMSTLGFIALALLFGVLASEQAKIKRHLLSIEARLRDKIDKPNDFEKWAEERKSGANE